VAEVLEGEAVVLSEPALALPFQDACGGDGRDAHAVADEQDDVAGAQRAPRLFAGTRGDVAAGERVILGG
jgi:hypothetical protein